MIGLTPTRLGDLPLLEEVLEVVQRPIAIRTPGRFARARPEILAAVPPVLIENAFGVGFPALVVCLWVVVLTAQAYVKICLAGIAVRTKAEGLSGRYVVSRLASVTPHAGKTAANPAQMPRRIRLKRTYFVGRRRLATTARRGL